jgi:hypothetical protein
MGSIPIRSTIRHRVDKYVMEDYVLKRFLIVAAFLVALIPGLVSAAPVGMVETWRSYPNTPRVYELIQYDIQVSNVGDQAGRISAHVPYPSGFVYYAHSIVSNTTGTTILCDPDAPQLDCHPVGNMAFASYYTIRLSGAWQSTGWKTILAHADAQGSGAGYDSDEGDTSYISP